jgi:DDE superfamily endonuclease
VICLDEMGPESAKSCPGTCLIGEPRPSAEHPERVVAQRAKQQADDGRRGKGYLFGAFRPATGDAMTRPYGARLTADFVDFLEHVDGWVETEVARIYAILDHLQAHRAPDVLLCSLAHPRWECVFQPKYAPYLNLIEPWGKVLRSLALKGRRVETWGQSCEAVRRATEYWNAQKHPVIWGRRRRHQPRRRPGIAAVPGIR